MPGPGGGSHGGGGFSGGFGGGGSHGGGGYGGPRGPRGPYYYGYRRRSIGSGLLGLILAPIIVLIMAVIFIIVGFGNAFSDIASGGSIRYDENAFQDYADEQYQAVFGSSTAYEDNILLVFLVDENEYKDFYFIAWVGDDIATSVNELFGNEQSQFGYSLANHVNRQSYKYSLDSNLAAVVEDMSGKVKAAASDPYRCKEDHVQVESELKNYSSAPMSEKTVNAALQEFTEETGIPMVIVVENVEKVLKKSVRGSSIVIGIIGILLIALAVFLTVKAVKTRRESKNGKREEEYTS